MPPVRLLVLGMHRSGTSLLAGAVHRLGASLPATPMPAADDNPDGFFESAPLVAVNDAILLRAASGWADWRRLDTTGLATADPALAVQMRDVFSAEFGAARFAVWKDPRLAALLPVWRPLLAADGAETRVLVAVRSPGAVARSLARRDGIPPGLAVLLWLRHLLDAERHTRDLTRAFVSFDALLADWRVALARAGMALRVRWPVAPDAVAEPFVRPRAADAVDPPEIASAYAAVWCRHAFEAFRALEAGAPDRDGAGPRATLDRLRDQFDDACRLFGGERRLAGEVVPPASVTPASVPASLAAEPPSVPAAERFAVPAAERFAVPAAGRLAVPAAERLAVPAAERLAVPAAERSAVPAAERSAVPAVAPFALPAAERFALSHTARPAVSAPERLVLDDVTVLAVDTRTPALAVRALARALAIGRFADAVLFTDRAVETPPGLRVAPIGRLDGVEAYGRFLAGPLADSVRTTHVLVVQWDGWPVDAAAWDPAFRRYDYVGARWAGRVAGASVGNGGFSLRSRRLLLALRDDPRLALRSEAPEDEQIGGAFRPILERDHGIVFAPEAVADRFSGERILSATPAFGFHGAFNLWRHCDDATLSAIAAGLPDAMRRDRAVRELVTLLRGAGRDRAADALDTASAVGHDPGHVTGS